MTQNMKAPCRACPFSKAAKPGALGGSPPETYIGQAFGAFMLPCHQACDFDDPKWKDKLLTTPQCAGAAIFRGHVGVAYFMPEAIHTLPASPVVFQNAVEFLAHHKRISPTEASRQLSLRPPSVLLKEQLDRVNTKVVALIKT